MTIARQCVCVCVCACGAQIGLIITDQDAGPHMEPAGAVEKLRTSCVAGTPGTRPLCLLGPAFLAVEGRRRRKRRLHDTSKINDVCIVADGRRITRRPLNFAAALLARAGIRWNNWIRIFDHGSIRIFE